MRRLSGSILRCIDCALLSGALAQALSAGQSPPPLLAVDRVRFLPAPGHEEAMLHGTIRGSIVSAQEGFELLAEIRSVPAPGKWTELSFANRKPYRWIKYEGAAGSRGWISKLEFYAGKRKLAGEVFGTYPRGPWKKVLDDKANRGIQGESPDGQYVGIDIGERASCPRPTLSPDAGEFAQATTVALRCNLPGAVIRYTTDGTLPAPDNGQVYSTPILIEKTTTLAAVSSYGGMAPSPQADAVYLIGPALRRTTLHIGNSLTANVVGRFSLHAKTAGVIHDTPSLLMGGGIARTLWNAATIGARDPRDQDRWKDLFTTTHSMGGVLTYPVSRVEQGAADWKKLWPAITNVSDVTFQPRDADVPEEADYTVRWLKLIRTRFPAVQPWLYVEWTERERQRPTDQGQLPSTQMKQVFPALTWEESMSAMLLYGEEVQRAIGQIDQQGKRPRIIPAALALGRIHRQIEQGQFPGVDAHAFASFLFSDRVHLNHEGSFLVEATWFAAFYGQSPEGRFLPLELHLTPQQALILQRLAWDVIKNYPDCGLYEAGTTPCGKPQFSPVPSSIKEATRVTLSSTTPGAWFRYTLDGTTPTRTRGYVYCGVVSVRPGMTLTAVAYKSGMADSAAAAALYPEERGNHPGGKEAK